MKLCKNTVDLIVEATKISNLLGIEGLILDERGIRGFNDDDGIIVCSMEDHGFEFEKLGIGRVESLKHKMTLIDTAKNLSVSAEMRQNDPTTVSNLLFDCGKINFTFKCAKTTNINDIPVGKMNTTPIFHFEITEEAIDLMMKSVSAMRCTNMTIIGKDSDVQFRFSDSESGDILNFGIDSELVGDEDEVSLTLNVKKMLPVFRMALAAAHDKKFRLNILKNNILYTPIGNMDVIIMPEV